MSDANNPLANLSRQEILWLAGILKDACRERLEKNLVSQAIEERLYQRGPVEGHEKVRRPNGSACWGPEDVRHPTASTSVASQTAVTNRFVPNRPAH